MHDEGIIKFTFQHRKCDLSYDLFGELCYRLIAWRRIMSETALVGRTPGRYGGAAYGNLSGRVTPFPGERGQRRFLITGSGTGGHACMSPLDFCIVESYNIKKNFVISRGPADPSSESMSHGTIYDLDSRIRFVFHAHSPIIWSQSSALRLPTTASGAFYGTPEMAEEIIRLFRTTDLSEMKILAMQSHEDGIIVFGSSAEEVGSTLICYLSAAYEKQCSQEGILCENRR